MIDDKMREIGFIRGKSKYISTFLVVVLLIGMISFSSNSAEVGKAEELRDNSREPIVEEEVSQSKGDRGRTGSISDPIYLDKEFSNLSLDIEPPTYRDLSVIRSRPIEINPLLHSTSELEKGSKLYLNLFEDANYTAEIEEVTISVEETISVRGSIEDFEIGYFVMSSTNGKTSGSIEIPEKKETFSIKPIEDSQTHHVLEIDKQESNILPSRSPLEPPSGPNENPKYSESLQYDNTETYETPKSANPTEMEDISNNEAQTNLNSDPMEQVTVDVMIVYTLHADLWASGNEGNINNVIDQAISRGNEVLDNSETYLDINLVYSAEVEYEESGCSGADLRRLTTSPENKPWGDTWTCDDGDTYDMTGYMNEIHDWRDKYGADLVALFSEVEDVGGLAWTLEDKHGREDMGFSLTAVQQAADTYTLIHELGHNMGGHHHRDQNTGPGPGLYNYSAGWRDPDEGICTVMTYKSGEYFNDGIDTYRIPYFSNPNIDYNGISIGDPDKADNARTLRETKHTIADYRKGGFELDWYYQYDAAHRSDADSGLDSAEDFWGGAIRHELPTGKITDIAYYNWNQPNYVIGNVYTDDDGEPGELVGETESYSPTDSMEWVEIPLTDFVTIEDSGHYWIILWIYNPEADVYPFGVMEPYVEDGGWFSSDGETWNTLDDYSLALEVGMAESAKFALQDWSIDSTTVEANETFSLEGDIENIGGQPGDGTIELYIDGDLVDVKDSEILGFDDMHPVTFQHSEEKAGTREIQVKTDDDSWTSEIDIEPAEVYYVIIDPSEDQTIDSGETIDFSAEAYDKYGNLITDDNTDFTWENADSSGTFDETDAGDYDVRAEYESETSTSTTVTVETSFFGYGWLITFIVIVAIIVVGIAIAWKKKKKTSQPWQRPPPSERESSQYSRPQSRSTDFTQQKSRPPPQQPEEKNVPQKPTRQQKRTQQAPVPPPPSQQKTQQSQKQPKQQSSVPPPTQQSSQQPGGQQQPQQSQQSPAPPSPKNCPSCNAEMRYIDEHESWWCDSCQEYK